MQATFPFTQTVFGRLQLIIFGGVLKQPSYFEDVKSRISGGFLPRDWIDPQSNEDKFYKANALPSELELAGPGFKSIYAAINF